MIGKQVVAGRAVTLPEVKSLIEKRKELGELTYEQKVSLEYAGEFSKLGIKRAREAVEALVELGLDEKKAVKVVDVRPKSKEELKLIFEKPRFSLSDDKVRKIFDIVASLD